jgi:hypothetical protein
MDPFFRKNLKLANIILTFSQRDEELKLFLLYLRALLFYETHVQQRARVHALELILTPENWNTRQSGKN